MRAHHPQRRSRTIHHNCRRATITTDARETNLVQIDNQRLGDAIGAVGNHHPSFAIIDCVL